MSEMPGIPAGEPKKSNQALIIAVVVVVLLCCLCFGLIAVWYLWNNGDALVGNAMRLIANFV